MEGCSCGPAGFPSQLIDEFLLLLRCKILLSKEDDSSLSDENGEILDSYGVIKQIRDLSFLREFGSDGGSEIELRELGKGEGGLERSWEGRSGDGHWR